MLLLARKNWGGGGGLMTSTSENRTEWTVELEPESAQHSRPMTHDHTFLGNLGWF